MRRLEMQTITYKNLQLFLEKIWWVWEDLNFRPHPYQGCALTKLSYRPTRVEGASYNEWITCVNFLLPKLPGQIGHKAMNTIRGLKEGLGKLEQR